MEAIAHSLHSLDSPPNHNFSYYLWDSYYPPSNHSLSSANANPMPSPAIPRSTSDPILSTSSTSKTAHICLPPSNRSTCSSSRSYKSSYWRAWSNVNKLGSFISLRRKNTDSHTDLTEESLEAHNRRQEAIIFTTNITADDRNAKCSPYYKGLTDYSLIISREKLHLPVQTSSSPGRESIATTVHTSTSLSSFVFVKMQEWSSCFSSSNKSSSTEDKQNKTNAFAPAPAAPASIATALASPPTPDPDPAVATTTTIKHNHPRRLFSSSSKPKKAMMNLESKETDKNALSVVHEEKPLRERVSSEFESSPPPAGPSRMSHTSTSNKDEKTDMLDERKFTWANKYQPKALKDFICNRDTAIKVQNLIRGVDCNHFIFEGPAGVGKRTMIWAMIQEAYGPDRVQTKEQCKAFNLKGESIGSIEVRIKVSSQHVEVNLSDLKGYEKHVIVELIKETNKSGISKNDLQSKHDTCRAIILYNADKLSADAVLYMKWLLERHKGSIKFFFCCSDVSKLQPIKEICSFVQLFLPSKEEIVDVLEFIAKEEGIELPHRFAERIAMNSKNNLRQAIRSLEASWQRSYPFTEDQEILTGWEDDIANIAKDMVQEQSPKQLYIIRGKLQNLIEHDVSPDFFFNNLVQELKTHLDEFCQVQLDSLYKDYNRKDGNMLEGENQLLFPHSRNEEASKRLHDPPKKKFQKFMNIEEFIAKFMSLYKLNATTNKSMQ